MSDALFCALLKFWRRKRGLSQLDLALTAGVSARHLSFLESGRARPSEEMVLRLMSVLAVPLRDQNEVLRAAAFPPRFPEAGLEALPPPLDFALTHMLRRV
jgi:transcriptional regulator with XRE-family HTH domain